MARLVDPALAAAGQAHLGEHAQPRFRSGLQLILRLLIAPTSWMILLESLSEPQFGRAFSHPQRGSMTIDKAIQLYALHGLHHTAHITGLRERRRW